MSILQASLSETIFDAALGYLRAGVSIIPLKGKLCALKSWSMAQQYRASEKVLRRWNADGLLQGVGIVCGKVSGNLVVLDFDSHEAVADFELTFPDLTDTFVVCSGSGRGAHFYYYSDELPSALLVKNHELRSNGMYVVGVPSPHPSGNVYSIRARREPMRLHNMREVVRWIKSKRPAPVPMQAFDNLPYTRPTPNLSREQWFRDRYVETALRRQVQFVVMASEGNRNNQLYWSAHALGQLVGAGALARLRVETELCAAAMTCGLPVNEAMNTIKSGLDAGTLRPRHIPGPPAR